jgi:AraC-like DNA-binding protein
MNPLYFSGAVQAFFGCILLQSKKNKQISDYVLIGLFFLFFVYLFTSCFIFDNSGISLLAFVLVQPLLFLVGPAIYVYTDLLTSNNQKFKKKYLFHAIPFFLSYVIYLSYFVAVGFDKLTLSYYSSLPYTRLILALQIISPIIYAQWVLAKVKTHQNYIKEEFSFFENINLNWIKYLCYGLIFINVACVTLITLENLFQQPFKYGVNYYTIISISLYVFYLSYFSFRQKSIFNMEALNKHEMINNDCMFIKMPTIDEFTAKDPEAIEKKIPNAIDNSPKNRRNMEELKNYEKRLYMSMEQKKLFLEPELSLAQLATHLNMTTHLLSQVLNECIMMNFYDFVNSYRVIEMKSKLANKNYDKYNIVVLAYESGFNSKASFQRIFKNHTGLTPTEYKRHLVEQIEAKEIELYASLV